MIGLVVADTVLVLLLGLVVAGLLRSHADITRALHELGAPLGDPARGGRPAGLDSPVAFRHNDEGTLEMGPVIPPRAAGSAVFELEGQSPSGDGLAISVTSAPATLLAFLSSGCTGCAGFWQELASGRAGLEDVRTVIVTKGPELEQPAAVTRLAPAPDDVPVVMSSKAWEDYEVPGSPFFVLVDGVAGRRAGEGTARSLREVAELVRAATDDRSRTGAPERDDVPTVDAELRAAGIFPGDPSLYPRTLQDVAPPRAGHPGGTR